MRLRRSLAVLAGACAVLLGSAPAAVAHPLGNFTVNRYDGLVAAPGTLHVTHVEDLAEIPATQAGPDLERLGTARWAELRCAEAARGSEVTVGGRRISLAVSAARAELRPGQAGLDTLRLECAESAPLPRGATVNVGFRSAGVSSGPGWREITARGDRMTLSRSDVPRKSVSRELTVYPAGLLSSPADTSTARLTLEPGGAPLAQERDAPGASVLPRGADRWTQALGDLVARRDLTLGFATLALLVAVGLGAAHALAPGHGKTLMAAAAAARGGRARLRDVLPLAASVTVTHTLGVVALGLLVTAGSAATPSVVAWLGVASGALVLGAGVNLVRRAWRGRVAQAEHTHEHVPAAGVAARAPAVVGGGDGGEAHVGTDHGAGAHTPTHGGEGHVATHHGVEAHTHAHAHAHGGHTHTHGGHTHSHPTAPTLKGTLLLGFAGGLVPSPSAVVVLVGAAALGQAWFGLLLVVAYGVGLALTLTAAGFAVVRLGAVAGRLLERNSARRAHPLAVLLRRTIPLASALAVLVLGASLMLKGVASAVG
ncbi:ABC-type nickel/cobalt efflux system permease component RcnA [Streptomyces sp. BK022]|uniref:nickel transporter n=1 Tax=Streptomyces sp. BK022 TaxID=2512123 RepID=UPI0010291B2B|nr:nickel transporter [Streptomyces sp. BK022]RZU28547.1 ABC-type nickel/cobalt efflux system permease component RcnA [Streptomyces sp. BK022]